MNPAEWSASGVREGDVLAGKFRMPGLVFCGVLLSGCQNLLGIRDATLGLGTGDTAEPRGTSDRDDGGAESGGSGGARGSEEGGSSSGGGNDRTGEGGSGEGGASSDGLGGDGLVQAGSGGASAAGTAGTGTVCTSADNRCRGTSPDSTLEACNEETGKLEAIVCSDQNCKLAGYLTAAGCGKSTSGTDACLCAGAEAPEEDAGVSNEDPCASQETSLGYFCGANLSTSADPERLYLCSNHETFASVVCPMGCHAGTTEDPDYCEGSADDPCMNSPFEGDACGVNLAVPLTGDAHSTLYICSEQQTVHAVECIDGCRAAPLGEPDQCIVTESASH